MLHSYIIKYFNIIQCFFIFVKHPKQNLESSISNKEKISVAITLFIVKFAFSILVASLIGYFYEPQNLTDTTMSSKFTPLLYLAVGGIILPLFEETMFHLSLVFKPLFLAITVASFGYYSSTKFIFASRLSQVDNTFSYRIAIGLLLGLIIYLILRNKTIVNKLKTFWFTRFNIIYYLSAITFAWLHLFNFELNYVNILLTPILTLPQFFSGLISGYLRVKIGFIYPLVLHILTNSILIGLSILVE